MEIFLRKCPHCEKCPSMQKNIQGSESIGFHVECPGCYHKGLSGISGEEAVENWNKRKS